MDLELMKPSPAEADQAITVLLVEDDAPTLWRLRDALADAGDFRSRPPARSPRPAPPRRSARRACC